MTTTQLKADEAVVSELRQLLGLMHHRYEVHAKVLIGMGQHKAAEPHINAMSIIVEMQRHLGETAERFDVPPWV